MLLRYLSGTWTAIAPSIGNHIWQSTLVAVIVGLLTLTLRKNPAQARYRLWMAASVKFLLPFSVLIAMGSHLRSSDASPQANSGLSFVMREVGQPFKQPTTTVISPVVLPTHFASLTDLLPSALLAMWLCGFLIVGFLRLLRWRRIYVGLRQAAPLQEGRLVEALRRLDHIGATQKLPKILLSSASLEPGVFGIVRPVVVWPERITSSLEDSHLEAILAHELSHIRRRDNLAAAMHMLVEAIFWFHPLVWWLGARMVEEREQACDEEVLEAGRARHVYAESILKICEFCVESRLTCVSGVTGADLKKRVVRIMSERVVRKLDFSKRLLLATVGSMALALPIVTGLLNATQTQAASSSWGHSEPEAHQAFEVASIRENTSGSESSTMNVPIGPDDLYPPNDGVLSATNVPLISFIYFAYGLAGSQFQLLLPHVPNWVVRDRFDIRARARGNPTKNAMRRMMRTLLAERFKLEAHYETKQLPVFALVRASSEELGPQLRPHPLDSLCQVTLPSPSDSEATGAILSNGLPASCGGIVALPSKPGRLRVGARNVPLDLLAATLPQIGNLDRAVLDKTELHGLFDFTFEWTPQYAAPTRPPEHMPERLSEPGLTFVDDLKVQLGLRLESQSGPVEVFVVDHAEKPSENQQ